jgi:hypothetical protein
MHVRIFIMQVYYMNIGWTSFLVIGLKPCEWAIGWTSFLVIGLMLWERAIGRTSFLVWNQCPIEWAIMKICYQIIGIRTLNS